MLVKVYSVIGTFGNERKEQIVRSFQDLFVPRRLNLASKICVVISSRKNDAGPLGFTQKVIDFTLFAEVVVP